MEKEFVSYEQALALKELGFDEPCFGYYIETREWIPASYSREGTVYPSNSDLLPGWVSAPLYQQAFRWMREKHGLIGLIEGGYDNGKNIFTYVIWEGFKDNMIDEYFISYEEAEKACLDKLIEICKNDNTSN